VARRLQPLGNCRAHLAEAEEADMGEVAHVRPSPGRCRR
jgi:hypothetical protein